MSALPRPAMAENSVIRKLRKSCSPNVPESNPWRTKLSNNCRKVVATLLNTCLPRPRFGQMSPELARCWPKLAQTSLATSAVKHIAKCAKAWPKWPKLEEQPMLAKLLLPSLAKLGKCWSKWAPHDGQRLANAWSMFVEFGKMFVEFG